jgi:hypothetical protein
MRLTDDEFKQFCQVIASLLTDMVPAKTDIDLPPPLQDLISSLKMLPLSDRLSRLEDGLAGLSGIDTDAVFNCVFSVDPRRPEDDPPAPSTPAPVLHPTPNSFQIPTPIIDLKPETKYDGFETISLSALMAMEDQGVEWLVDRLIPTGSASILGGYAGQGKSWMLMDLALSVVSGLRWLGRFSTRQGQILYIDEESGIKLLRRRLGRLINGRGMSISTDGLEFVVQKGICLADKQSLGLLRGTIARTKPILVIIDSLIRVHGSEENSASDMAKVFAEIKRIIRDFGCSVLFADHQKKPGIGSVSQDLLLRGTTEKVAFVDTLLSVARKNDVLVVEHSKSRFEQPVPPFVIEIEDVAQDKTVVRVVGDAEQVQRQSREEEALAFIHNVLVGGSWKTRKEIADSAKKAGVKVRVLSELLATLTEQGVLERDDRKVNPGRGSKTAHYRKCPAANYVSDFTSTSNRENVNELETDSGDPNGTLWTESGGDPE